MAYTQVLGQNDFAIRVGAKFKFDATGTKIILNQDGSVSLNISFTLQKAGQDLQTGPGNVNFDSGVFNTTSPNAINQISKASMLSLGNTQNTDQIWLKSDQDEYKLSTFADKGRQGNQIIDEAV